MTVSANTKRTLSHRCCVSIAEVEKDEEEEEEEEGDEGEEGEDRGEEEKGLLLELDDC